MRCFKGICCFLFPALMACLGLNASAQSGPKAEFDPHHVIVKFKAEASRRVRQGTRPSLARLKRIAPLRADSDIPSTSLPGSLDRLFVAEVDAGSDIEEVVKEWMSNPEVEYAEPDYIMHGHGWATPLGHVPLQITTGPGDPDWFWQWGMQNRGQMPLNPGIPGMDVNVVPAWEVTTGDSNTILAVLDSGIAAAAPDFAGRILPGHDYVNNDDDPADDQGHGTNVASVAAAEGGNGVSIAGMNWKCRILPIKVLNSAGTGPYSWLINGLMFAADHGARVIDVSVGGTAPNQSLAAAVTYAQSRGAIIVASMGNSNNEIPEYPAAYPGIIAVGAINNRGLRAVPFSSGGGGSNYGSHISFIAPGDMILGINYADVTQSSYHYGTSDAVPFVGGLITLMLAINPVLSQQQVYEILKANARDQIGLAGEDTAGFDKYYGWGLIDAYRSLLAVPASSDTYFAQTAIGGGYTTTFTFLNTGADETFGALSLTGDDGNPLVASFTSPGGSSSTGSTFQIRIPSGGTQSVKASAMGSGDPTSAGWAHVQSSGGSLQGVATFQFMDGNTLSTIVGVLSADPTSSATIPVNDDRTMGSLSRVTGYAVTNPGNENINIQLVLLNADGTVARTIAPPKLNPLAPGCHVSRFLWEDLDDPALRFKGSMALIASSGMKFSIVALVLNQGLYTAIPVIPGNAPIR